jgi:gas vesicle protein
MGNKNKSKSPGKILGSILLAVIIAAFSGFFIGLIFAPQSGKNFRKLLAKKFLELIDRSKFAMIEAKVMAEEFIEKNLEKDSGD